MTRHLETKRGGNVIFLRRLDYILELVYVGDDGKTAVLLVKLDKMSEKFKTLFREKFSWKRLLASLPGAYACLLRKRMQIYHQKYESK